jgi:apolipoprotein N-acyltransferase
MKFNVNKINPYWLLIIGIAFFTLAHMSISVDFFAWFANVPFLLYLSITKGWKTRLLFVFALIAAWSFVILKIVSPPMPIVMIFLFSVPISLFHLPAYLVWSKFKKNIWSVLLFPAVFIIMEWIQYTFTPFGSWGIMAYSQSNSINIMQFSSIFGLAGLSFLIYWINVSIVRIITTHKITKLTLYAPSLILILVIIYGSLRLDIGKSKGVNTMTVAAIGTDSDVGGLPLPSKDSNETVILNQLQRTEKAADFGAELIVWNEGAFYALPDEENRIINRIKTLAKDKGVSIYAAYIKPLSQDTFKYDNKYVYINKIGEVEYTYLKHQPVPGEPATQGKEPFQTFKIAESEVGGAICYDYDFPYIAREYGKLNADIVALPSSDWRGIEPLHTRMAAFRAIEQGHSIVRSTRFGLSAIISPYGEMIGQSSSFDTNNKILISNVPAKGVSTLYSVIGDLFVYMCFGFILVFFTLLIIKKPAAKDGYK